MTKILIYPSIITNKARLPGLEFSAVIQKLCDLDKLLGLSLPQFPHL